MALVRWDPFTELNSLHDQVNSLFNEAFGSTSGGVSTMSATDVYSTDNGLAIEAQLPNFKENEISVSQHNGELEIKAEHQEKDQNRKYIVRESTSQYYRRFTLPRNTDADNIKAHFENGLLKVEIPYKELPEPKRIAIKSRSKQLSGKKNK